MYISACVAVRDNTQIEIVRSCGPAGQEFTLPSCTNDWLAVFASMAKKKIHTSANQSVKAHKNGACPPMCACVVCCAVRCSRSDGGALAGELAVPR